MKYEVTACDGYSLQTRVRRGERGGWKKGTWGRRWWVYEKENRREGHNRHSAQHSTVSRLAGFSLVLPGFTFRIPPRGQGQIIHIPLSPLIVSAHTAPSVIPHSTANVQPTRRLFVGLPAIPPPNSVAPCPDRCKALYHLSCSGSFVPFVFTNKLYKVTALLLF